MKPSEKLWAAARDVARPSFLRRRRINLDLATASYIDLVSTPSDDEWREHMIMRLSLAAVIAEDEGQ